MKFARPWTTAEFETAKRLYVDGMHIMDISRVVKRTAASVKTKICEAHIKREKRAARIEGPAVDRPIRPLWDDDDIAAAYERAGIRYRDIANPRRDPRRFVSGAWSSGCGNATAMCAEAVGAQ